MKQKLKKYGLMRSILMTLYHVVMPKLRYYSYRVFVRFDHIGKNIKIYPEVEFDNPRLSLGDNVIVGRNVRFGSSGKISIGNNTGVGAFSCIEAINEIRIGNDCQIARFCYFIDHDHYYANLDVPMVKQTNFANDFSTSKKIIVSDNCWIGTRVTILKGVTIGKGAIIGAGSVVTKDVSPYTIVAGVPAKVIKQLRDEK